MKRKVFVYAIMILTILTVFSSTSCIGSYAKQEPLKNGKYTFIIISAACCNRVILFHLSKKCVLLKSRPSLGNSAYCLVAFFAIPLSQSVDCAVQIYEHRRTAYSHLHNIIIYRISFEYSFKRAVQRFPS